jgi:ATP-dependent DNA helicase RecG
VPRRYIDLSTTKTIRFLKIGEEATTQGTVTRVDGRYVRSKRHLLTVTIKDETGSLSLVWWNQAFRTKAFVQGQRIVIAGRLERNRGQLSITNPFYEALKADKDQVHTGRVIPIHSTTQ